MQFISSICVFAALCVLGLLGADGADSKSRAFVLLDQKLVNRYVGERQNMTIKFSAVNVGQVAATDIKISIPGWPVDLFEPVENSITASSSRLDPGETFEYEFTVRPKKAFTFASADSQAKIEYRYQTEDNGIGEKLGYASGFPDLEILTEKRFKRLTATNIGEWTEFGVLATATWLLPLVGWFLISGSISS